MLGISVNDEKFLSIMREGVKIDKYGKIEVPLPFKDGELLPCNRWPVYHRTKNTLDRLKSYLDDVSKCLDVMRDTLASGFVERVPNSELAIEKGKGWWLPIFPVWVPGKKPRLVVDAGAKYQGTSLNNYLLKGPDINHKLRALLQNFREDKIAIMGDIQSMFCNFSVSPDHRNFLRFFLVG